ncbi:MAG TPA: hypothetical protein VFJ95_12865, partial [Gammaproteobacteria bacterium]|nr:hypothetical protein [Gammaproteobacteria bacterium]
IGNFLVNVQPTLLSNYETAAFPGADFIDYTGTTSNNSFDYRLLSTVTYAKNAFSIGLRWQHLPSLDVAPNAGPTALGVDSHDQLDLFGTWRFNERWSLRYGVDNLTNADPEWVGRSTTNNAIGSTNNLYDQIGRRLFFGLTMTL